MRSPTAAHGLVQAGLAGEVLRRAGRWRASSASSSCRTLGSRRRSGSTSRNTWLLAGSCSGARKSGLSASERSEGTVRPERARTAPPSAPTAYCASSVASARRALADAPGVGRQQRAARRARVGARQRHDVERQPLDAAEVRHRAPAVDEHREVALRELVGRLHGRPGGGVDAVVLQPLEVGQRLAALRLVQDHLRRPRGVVHDLAAGGPDERRHRADLGVEADRRHAPASSACAACSRSSQVQSATGRSTPACSNSAGLS